MISIFFCKQKTAYEMRISDWSSDVCSSDLIGSHETFPKIATAPRRQDIFKRQRAIAYGHHGVGLIRERGMITGSKISTPIHLDMILRSQRAIFGHRSYEHQLLFERSEEHTSELQSLMRISYAVFCLKNKKNPIPQ